MHLCRDPFDTFCRNYREYPFKAFCVDLKTHEIAIMDAFSVMGPGRSQILLNLFSFCAKCLKNA